MGMIPHIRDTRDLLDDRGGDTTRIAHLFDVSIMEHMCSKMDADAAPAPDEMHAKYAITMVHADCAHNAIFVCIGSSLQVCHPPETAARLLAGCQHESGFKDGHRADARLSTVQGVAVDHKHVVFFTDCLNNCVREVSTAGQVRTIYGAAPITFSALNTSGVSGFCDGIGTQARFHRPWGISLYDQEKEIIVVDSYNSSLRRIHRGSGYVSTIQIRQDTSPDEVTGLAPQPTQLFYPTTICTAQTLFGGANTDVRDAAYIYVVSSSCFEVLRIHLVTGVFRALHCTHNPDIQYRPMSLSVTTRGCMVVAYSGCELRIPRKNVKCVKFGDLELFSTVRRPVSYMNEGRIEFCACLSISLAIHASTRVVTLWITDAQAESRLLRVCLKLKWSFLRVLLLAVRKPTHNRLFSILPMCTHGKHTFCPLLEHIVILLQGVIAFA